MIMHLSFIRMTHYVIQISLKVHVHDDLIGKYHFYSKLIYFMVEITYYKSN